jgi:hypothetical protein
MDSECQIHSTSQEMARGAQRSQSFIGRLAHSEKPTNARRTLRVP